MLEYKDVLDWLDYDYCSGKFTWIKDIRRGMAGKEAGCVRPDGRRVIRFKGTLYYASHLAWLMSRMHWPQYEIDHIDGNPSNDAFDNLRDVPGVVNSRNQSSRAWDCNVYQTPDGMWGCYVLVGRKKIRLGKFTTVEEAVAARREAQEAMHFHTNHARATA